MGHNKITKEKMFRLLIIVIIVTSFSIRIFSSIIPRDFYDIFESNLSEYKDLNMKILYFEDFLVGGESKNVNLMNGSNFEIIDFLKDYKYRKPLWNRNVDFSHNEAFSLIFENESKKLANIFIHLDSTVIDIYDGERKKRYILFNDEYDFEYLKRYYESIE